MLGALRDEEDSTRTFWVLATASYKPIPKRDRKYGFMEPYDADAVAEHAFWVVSLLHVLETKGILAQLVRPDVSWFGLKEFEGLNISRHDYLRSVFKGARKEEFSGALEFDRLPICFINLFLDFPYANRCSDVELLCRHKPLVVTFSHHLTVDFATPQFGLFRQVKAFFRNTNLRVIETMSPQKALEQSRRLDALFRNIHLGVTGPSPENKDCGT
jgi:hypothetical protein